MEFNKRTMAETGERKVDDTEIFYPCELVDALYKNNCYYELSQWYLSASENNFEKTAALCGQVIDADNKLACFHGLVVFLGVIDKFESVLASHICSELDNTYGYDFDTCLMAYSAGLPLTNDIISIRGKICGDVRNIENKSKCRYQTLDEFFFTNSL
jgi:hypothetical protein